MFGQGSGPIVLDDVRCTGTEERLVDCPYDQNTADCSHSQDSSVRCQITCEYNSTTGSITYYKVVYSKIANAAHCTGDCDVNFICLSFCGSQYSVVMVS